MLQNAADPNLQNNNGLTPLIISVDHPDLDSIQCLVINNADVSLKVRYYRRLQYIHEKMFLA